MNLEKAHKKATGFSIEEGVKKAVKAKYNLRKVMQVPKGTSVNVPLFKLAMAIGREQILLDPAYWQAVGRAEGWGDWSSPLEKIEHEWELDHYISDTAKTPYYVCKKACTAYKVKNVIFYDEYESGETSNVKKAGYKGILASAHNIVFKKGWLYHQLRFVELLGEEI